MADASGQAAERSYQGIQVGEKAEFTRVIGEDEVQAFAALTGDRNPLHMDAAYASATRFGRRVVHGMLVASYFSTLIGMHLPGRHAVYLSQDVQFALPVHIGDRLTFSGRVRRKSDGLRLLDIETSARNQTGEVVVRGRAQVMVLHG